MSNDNSRITEKNKTQYDKFYSMVNDARDEPTASAIKIEQFSQGHGL